MPSQITNRTQLLIRAPARLHLGFLDPDGWLGRRFASIGFAISEPETVLTVKKATAMTASGHELARTQKLLERFATDLNLKHSYAADVQHAIPAHAGLGSGTQLALALGTGLLRLEGAPIGTRALGEMVDRGARSAIGMTAFDQGGFIVDGGKTDSTTPPPVLMRSDMPQHWRIVLILDPEATGVHGQMEREAFTKLDRLPQKTAARLCHLTMMQMLPALKEADLAIFGSAVSEMQEVIGAYFAPMQGGSAWASPAVQEIAQKMKDHGAVGIGQSSWGPTGYGFVEDQPAAERLYRTLVEDAKAKGLSLKIVAPRNSGATIDLV